MSWGIVPSLSYAVYKMGLAKIDESDECEVIKQAFITFLIWKASNQLDKFHIACSSCVMLALNYLSSAGIKGVHYTSTVLILCLSWLQNIWVTHRKKNQNIEIE